MKYMLFTYRDPSVQLDPEQRAAVPAAVAAWCEEMDARTMSDEVRVAERSSPQSTVNGDAS
jgi:hypothetical protein